MNTSRAIFKMDTLLVGLLRYGTWLASLTIAAGLAGEFLGIRFGRISDAQIVTAGIALFILLPVLRVALMLIVFVRERDRMFIAFAAIVLTIILSAFAVGRYMAKAV